MNDTFRQLTTVIAGEVLERAVTQLAEVGAEIQEVEAKAKTAKQELRELTNAINSGTLQGEALQTATEKSGRTYRPDWRCPRYRSTPRFGHTYI